MDEVRYMTEFMKQFGEDIEVIWGTAIDESLKGKVKFTVLATGFDLESIPEIKDIHDSQRTRMSEAEIMEEEARLRTKEREKELIAKYYGKKLGSKRIPHKVMNASIAVLTANELDDDAIIRHTIATLSYCSVPAAKMPESNKRTHQKHRPHSRVNLKSALE